MKISELGKRGWLSIVPFVIAATAGLLTGCSKGPPYVGTWNWDAKDAEIGGTSGVILEIKNDGTFSAFLDGAGRISETQSGTYTVVSSNANDIVFSIRVQSSLPKEGAEEGDDVIDSGLAGGTLEWSKDADTGKEIVKYSYTHVGGGGESFQLERYK